MTPRLVHEPACDYLKNGVCSCVEVAHEQQPVAVRNWLERGRQMLIREKATEQQAKQFWALPAFAQKRIIRNFDRKVKLENDPRGPEKIRAAQEKRKRQVERQLRGQADG
jgi:hypothetical protein